MPQRPRLTLPDELSLRAATAEDDGFLYQLLEERYASDIVNVGGLASPELPTFEQHVAYLRSQPYARMEIVQLGRTRVGMVYLTPQRVFGCFVLASFAGRGIGLAACFSFLSTCSGPVTINVNPANRPSVRSAERLGFVRTAVYEGRITFELSGPPLDPFHAVRQRRR